jgi:hypothetical protein
MAGLEPARAYTAQRILSLVGYLANFVYLTLP